MGHPLDQARGGRDAPCRPVEVCAPGRICLRACAMSAPNELQMIITRIIIWRSSQPFRGDKHVRTFKLPAGGRIGHNRPAAPRAGACSPASGSAPSAGVRMSTIWRSPSSCGAILARTRPKASGSGQSTAPAQRSPRARQRQQSPAQMLKEIPSACDRGPSATRKATKSAGTATSCIWTPPAAACPSPRCSPRPQRACDRRADGRGGRASNDRRSDSGWRPLSHWTRRLNGGE